MTDPRAALPLSALDFAVLLALAPGPSYGYRILKALREQAGGGIELAPGNLYQVLDRLTERSWIEETGPSAEEQGNSRPRRYYGLTVAGRAILAAEARRLDSLLGTARVHDLLPEGGGG
jgi:DNA-binding PadR family transcriptional regulator